MGARERKRSAYRDVARIQAQCVAKFVDCHGHQVDVAGGATGRPGVRQPGCHNTGSWTPHRAELAYNVWKVEFSELDVGAESANQFGLHCSPTTTPTSLGC